MNTNRDKQLEYETFLRWAYGLNQGIHLDRYGDPGGVANTECFTIDNFECVKAATAYAMMIYQKDIFTKLADVPPSERDRLEQYVKDVINAPSLDSISDLITSFNESFVDKYYLRRDGKFFFKNLEDV